MRRPIRVQGIDKIFITHALPEVSVEQFCCAARPMLDGRGPQNVLQCLGPFDTFPQFFALNTGKGGIEVGRLDEVVFLGSEFAFPLKAAPCVHSRA